MSIKKIRLRKAFILSTLSIYGFIASYISIFFIIIAGIKFSINMLFYTGILPIGLLLTSIIIKIIYYRNEPFFTFNRKILTILSFFLWLLILTFYAYLSENAIQFH